MFEVVQSNTVQPTKLFYQKNIISSSIAMIFLNTESMGVKYKNAMSRGSMALRLFQDVLEIEDV